VTLAGLALAWVVAVSQQKGNHLARRAALMAPAAAAGSPRRRRQALRLQLAISHACAAWISCTDRTNRLSDAKVAFVVPALTEHRRARRAFAVRLWVAASHLAMAEPIAGSGNHRGNPIGKGLRERREFLKRIGKVALTAPAVALRLSAEKAKADSFPSDFIQTDASRLASDRR